MAMSVLTLPHKNVLSQTSGNLLNWLPSKLKKWVQSLLQPLIFVFLEILLIKCLMACNIQPISSTIKSQQMAQVYLMNKI
jgi:branched-subunit amino acid permease